MNVHVIEIVPRPPVAGQVVEQEEVLRNDDDDVFTCLHSFRCVLNILLFQLPFASSWMCVIYILHMSLTNVDYYAFMLAMSILRLACMVFMTCAPISILFNVMIIPAMVGYTLYNIKNIPIFFSVVVIFDVPLYCFGALYMSKKCNPPEQ
jgi:hypothetical protein